MQTEEEKRTDTLKLIKWSLVIIGIVIMLKLLFEAETVMHETNAILVVIAFLTLGLHFKK